MKNVKRKDKEEKIAPGLTNEELLRELELQRDLMIAVATGGPRIESVNQGYKDRRRWIQDALKERGYSDPNQYADLWAWYGKWSSGDLPTYRSRRQYINNLYSPLIERLKSPEVIGEGPLREPTGWARVDRGVDSIRRALETASTEEDFQAVGLHCRETLISLAQAVYDPTRHTPSDVTHPSETDANRMLELFISMELSGSSNEEARKHAKASLSFANALQHKRTANFRDAALCAEATVSVVNIIAIVSGRRDPN